MRNKSKWHSILLIGLVVLLASSMVACDDQGPPPSSTIGFSPSSLSFSAEEGGANPSSKTLNISNSGGGTLDWWVSDDADWLSLSPTSGTNTGEIEEVTVSVDIMDMNAGNYTANITISASGASNNPQTIVVDLSIVEIPPETLSVHFEVKIEYPLEASSVQLREMVRGTSQNVPKGQVVWVVVHSQEVGLYYPQNHPADVQIDGDWTSLAFIGVEEDVGNKFDIIAVIAGVKVQDRFNSYLAQAKSEEVWPGLETFPEGTVICDHITVTRK